MTHLFDFFKLISASDINMLTRILISYTLDFSLFTPISRGGLWRDVAANKDSTVS